MCQEEPEIKEHGLVTDIEFKEFDRLGKNEVNFVVKNLQQRQLSHHELHLQQQEDLINEAINK